MSPRRVMVSADLMELLGETVTEIMQQGDGVHGRDWLDEVTTSRTSQEKGGVIRLQTDQDWKIAFLIWYHGRPDIVRRLPREEE